MKISPTIITLILLVLGLGAAILNKKPVDLSSFTSQLNLCDKGRKQDSAAYEKLLDQNDSLVLLSTKLTRELGVLKSKQTLTYRSKKKVLTSDRDATFPLWTWDEPNYITLDADSLLYNGDSLVIDTNHTIKPSTRFSLPPIDTTPMKFANGGDSLMQWLVRWFPGDSVDVAVKMSQNLRIAFVQKKVGFLNTGRDYNFTIDSDNPYITTTQTQYKLRKWRYDYSLGIGVGYGAHYTNKGLTPAPYVGVNLNYNVVNFGKRWLKL